MQVTLLLRCWALQILNLEHDPLPDVIEQLSAAGEPDGAELSMRPDFPLLASL